MIINKRSLMALSFIMLFALTACSSMPKGSAEEAEVAAVNDPIEPVNRTIFDVNDFLDRLLIRPMAELYRVTVPPPLRDRIASILKNMSEPVIFANNLLQGEVTNAGTTAQRFLVNTTAGVGGMFEVASGLGLERQTGDFGQTLHTWGLGEGPYLVLPLFGPSNVRDAVGLSVDTVMSPWKYIVAFGDTVIEDTFATSDMVASGLTRREANIEGYDALREGSLDFYAQMRSVYRQYRAKQLGVTPESQVPVFEDYDAENSTPVLR
ncbi:MAG: VacJ family lipoprotein [Proteobacteria bacterium]|jgi:phospholipid-binding lipoprotein MlaA|nr:VacJ family lipoprotein [Alphaproteobacteria bacterium]NCC02824.1 VacJ family lipoprotein [Pseudomonadota bacterium]